MSRPTPSTPLVASRTLDNARGLATTSRLPTRRPSLGGESNVPMTAGRLPILSRRTSISEPNQAPATISRLPTRRPSITGLRPMSLQAATPIQAPRSAISSTLKRTSSAAGLAQEAELTNTKRLLTTSQHDLTSLQITHERALQSLSATNTLLSSQLTSALASTSALEKANKLLTFKIADQDQSKSTESELKRERDQLRGHLREHQDKITELENEQHVLSSHYRKLAHEESQAREEIAREKIEKQAMMEEAQRDKESRASLESKYEEEKVIRRALEQELEKAREGEKAGQEASVIRGELHHLATHLKRLEADNDKLNRELDTYKNQHANIEILKEAKKGLENKLKGMDELRARCATVEVDAMELKREKEEWLSFLSPTSTSTGFTSPRKLTKTLAATQIENASYKEKVDAREAEIKIRDRMIGEFEERCKVLEREADASKRGMEKSEGRAKQVEKRIELRDKEVELLKNSLATYSAEESLSANFDAANAERIAQLEELLQVHKRELIDSSRQVAHWRGLVERYGGSTTEIISLEERERRENEEEDDTGVIVGKSFEEQLKRNEMLQEELEELKNENTLMIKEIDALDLQVSRLSYAHNNGAYNPLTTKVLELKLNPDTEEYAIRTSTLERLRDENNALLERVAVLEKGKGGSDESSDALVPRESLTSLRKEFEDLQGVIEQKEKMNLRLLDAYSKKADEFRKAVFSLLGYRFDVPASGKIRVLPMYAATKHQSITFTSTPGDIGLMEINDGGGEEGKAFAEEIQSCRYWVERGSIPCFLASLTMTLHDKYASS